MSIKHPKATAAINGLPNEVLTEIFILSKPDFPNVLGVEHLPQVFLRVCKHWNDLALHTSYLWSSFLLPLSDKRHDQLPEITSLWIWRSYPLPFSIRTESSPKTSSLYRDFPDLTKAICAASDRWGDIQVELPSETARPLVLASLQVNDSAVVQKCTRLSVFTLDREPDLQGQPDVSVMWLRSIPNIPELHLKMFLVVLRQKVDLGAMRCLNLEFLLDADSFFILVESAPYLEKLRVRFKGRKMEYQGEPVSAPKLLSLNIEFDIFINKNGGGDGEGGLYTMWDLDSETGGYELWNQGNGYDFSRHIFHKLTAPSLVTLCLTEMTDWGTTQLTSAKDFVIRSGCPLKRFYYCRGVGSDDVNDNIRSFCQMIPSLEEVEVRIMSLREESSWFLSQLANPQTMPLLKFLTYGPVLRSKDILTAPFQESIKCRIPRNGGSLQKITFLEPLVFFRRRDQEEYLMNARQDLGIEISLQEGHVRHRCGWDY